MMSVPAWALTLAYWVHMAATVAWIGGLFYQGLILEPVLARFVDPDQIAPLLASLRRRFQPLAWMSLALLFASGLTQMAGSPNYEGFLVIQNRWAAAIIAKHLTIFLMIAVAAYQTWVLHPELERAALRKASDQVGELAGRQNRSHRLNIALSIVVLGLTAIARTA